MTGIEMIKKERDEQISKHGYTAEKDLLSYGDHNTLVLLAQYLLLHKEDPQRDDLSDYLFKEKSGPGFPFSLKMNFDKKCYVERLAIAGALLAGEIDRYWLQIKNENEEN